MRLVSGPQAMVQLRDKSFERFGNDEHDVVGGGYGSVGIKLTENISLEVFAEGRQFCSRQRSRIRLLPSWYKLEDALLTLFRRNARCVPRNFRW